jgi:hypothetical protein
MDPIQEATHSSVCFSEHEHVTSALRNTSETHHICCLDDELSYCPPGNLACADDQQTIALVHLYGEQGTEIRDETTPSTKQSTLTSLAILYIPRPIFDNAVS